MKQTKHCLLGKSLIQELHARGTTYCRSYLQEELPTTGATCQSSYLLDERPTTGATYQRSYPRRELPNTGATYQRNYILDDVHTFERYLGAARRRQGGAIFAANCFFAKTMMFDKKTTLALPKLFSVILDGDRGSEDWFRIPLTRI